VEFVKQTIPDVLLIEPTIYGDERGFFMESFRQDLFDAAVGHHISFIQDNESRSIKGVLRGLHYQLPPFAQSKLVRVLEGEVLDVAVDIRSTSPTFGQHVAVKLSGANKKQLFVPKGFAHGFVVLSDTAVFSYKVDNYYSPENDRGIAANDVVLNIDWLVPGEEQLTSEKDMDLPSFSAIGTPF
jgi:dTDP-4-dehydrorhamnose 3,5-epimerase